MSLFERLAVIGDPVEHSLSPAMHQAALDAAGLPHRYEARHIAPHELAGSLDELRGGYRGFNVTLPHKVAIMPLLDALDGIASGTGAVNTVRNDGGRLTGYNTDVAGFSALLAAHHMDVAGRRVVLFGAGGAARAVTLALARMGTDVLAVVSRDPERARRLPVDHRKVLSALAYEDSSLAARLAEADMIVNATSLGLGSLADRSPLRADALLRPDAVVVDLVYGRRTPFLRQGELQGCRTIDGLEMLVQQGAAAFRLWTGVEPDVGVMRAACREAVPC